MIFDLTARELVAEIFLVGGAFFLLASAIGMLRLPDFTAGCMPAVTVRPLALCFPSSG